MILQGQTWLSEISRKIFRKAEVDLACSAISDKFYLTFILENFVENLQIVVI